jgi:aldose sugar dehydrogenase
MFKFFGLLSLIVSFGFVGNLHFFTSAGKRGAKNDTNRDPQKNYADYCSGCHGEKMNAFVDRKWKYGNSDPALFKTIKYGHPDAGMPSFQAAFTDKEINELVNYIKKGIENVKRYDFEEPVKSNVFKTKSLTIRLDTVAKGIQVPWGMAFLPNGDMLITERGGKMYRVTKDKALHNINGVPQVVAEGQGGIMDIALHPDFKKNHFVYFSYALGKSTDSGLLVTTAIAKARLEGNSLLDVKNIFVALPYSKTRHHYGGRLAFDKNNFLYITVGERGNEKQNPQSLKNDLGKVHRIKDDGTIPTDNPFVHIKGAKPSIYSYGHRNPQGAVIHPITETIWTNEHGPRGGDEINIIHKGKNYGWPAITYGINYNGRIITNKTALPGMEQPLHYWIPSIAPSGMAFVTGERYKGWKGHLLIGSLRFKYLNLCQIKGNKVINEEILFKNIGRVRDVRMGPDGYIYISVENPGAVFRLVPLEN